MKSKFVARLLALLLAACLSTLAVAAAAPTVSQPARPSAVIKPEARMIPGELAITAPTAGATWKAMSTQTVAWNGTGPRLAGPSPVTPLGPVDVTLWKDGQLAATVAAAATADRVTYTVPVTLDSGAYELRVTSKNFTNLEARQPLTIKNSIIFGGSPSTLTPPATTIGH